MTRSLFPEYMNDKMIFMKYKQHHQHQHQHQHQYQHQASKCQEHLSHQQPELQTEQLLPRRLREPGATSRGIDKVRVNEIMIV